MTGNWNVDVQVGKLPQKVATAMANLNEVITGAEYKEIAYLGSQVVNGTNHAVLAKQTVLTGKDTTNIVMLVFNEKPGDMVATLINIEHILDSGTGLGSVTINDTFDMDENAKATWDDAFEIYIGLRFEPFAYLGTKMTKGLNHIFMAKMISAGPDDDVSVGLVAVNQMTHRVFVSDVFEDKAEATLGYAFSWM